MNPYNTDHESDAISVDDFDSNEIDIDLTKGSETFDNNSETVTNTDSHTDTPNAKDELESLHTFLEDRILAIDPLTTMAHGKLDYHTHFHPHYTPPDKDGTFGKTLYKRPPPTGDTDSEELGLVFFGEVCSSVYGTAISAKGNHYAGMADFPKACKIYI